jgi:hypothetical protein
MNQDSWHLTSFGMNTRSRMMRKRCADSESAKTFGICPSSTASSGYMPSTGSSQVDATLGGHLACPNLKWNEAISTKTITRDEALKNFFEIDNATLAKVNSKASGFR